LKDRIRFQVNIGYSRVDLRSHVGLHLPALNDGRGYLPRREHAQQSHQKEQKDQPPGAPIPVRADPGTLNWGGRPRRGFAGRQLAAFNLSHRLAAMAD